ncbi:VPA1267 family protein [Vibrio sp. F74]|uniref:VPA1267 family protein n=1 Tax=Vibrio sp. F74 TaxID=700020 RepID=UPI0035F59988
MAKKKDVSQAQESLDKFEAWAGSLSDADFVAIGRGAKLNRSEVAKGTGIARSTLNDNDLVKAALLALEGDLRSKGVLAPLAEGAKEQQDSGVEKLYDQSGSELKRLKTEVERLKTKCLNKDAEIERLRSKLEQYTELSEVLSGSGVMPR